jgi:hypothetical protein
MADDSMHNPEEGTSDIMINIPESVKKNLPKDFNIGDIGKIDLLEAEKIANEDILFLNEKDLAEGLEDFDLIPLKDTQSREDLSLGIDESKGSHKPDIKDNVPGISAPSSREALLSTEAKRMRDAGKAPLPEAFDETIVSERDSRKEAESVDRRSPTSPRIAEGYIESDDEYVIWDMPDKDGGITESKINKTSQMDETLPDAEKIAGTRAGEKKKISEAAGEPRTAPDEDDVIISLEDLDEKTQPLRSTVLEELVPLENNDAVRPAAERYPTASAARYDRDRNERRTFLLEDEVYAKVSGMGQVFFIDDKQHGVQDDRTGTFDESGLDNIVSGIVQVDEGSSYVLQESGVDEDRERIAVIADEFRPAYEDLFVDLDYKYGDEELDYIHTAIVEEDYSSYIREIDEFFGTSTRTVPAAVELLGLTADEFDTIEDLLFQGDFKDIHMYDRYHLYEFDRASREGSPRERKTCRYLLPDQNSLVDVERDSIESDVSSNSALIFEEDVEDIKEQLKRRTGKSDVEAIKIVERALIDEIVQHESNRKKVQEKNLQETGRENVPVVKTAAAEGLFDITDRVVILNDEADVERFVSGFPEHKQVNIKMLLKYLDGLFERLPEEVIKKFASSEYFDLYLKVLNELGV